LLHIFELAIVLEVHAVSRAAASQQRDLRPAHLSLADFSTAEQRAGWAAHELAFHRAVNDQGGNVVLASLAERTLRDGLRACPILSGDVLSMLHAQHREILRCVEANAADAAAQHTRVHLLSLRNVLVDGARRGATQPRVQMHT
jgi:DNA-binding GntR family transcriptional regulator